MLHCGAVNWINQNQSFLQTISSALVALLTLVLIVITIIYVRANWRVMKIMETDLRYRTKPLPSLVVETKAADIGYPYRLTITAMNAPLRFLELKLVFFHEDLHSSGKQFGHEERFPLYNRVLRLGEAFV